MSDLISRRAAIKAINDLPNCPNGYSDTYDKACFIGVLEGLPSAQPEREKGKWERTGRKNVYGGYEVKCSICGDNLMITDIYREHYCRNCGAKMEDER